MNILLVHNFYKIPGGEDTVVANEMKLLEDHGHKVILYKRSNEELDDYHNFQKLKLPFQTVFSINSYKDLKKIVKNEHIDIMHVHNTVCVISPSAYYAAFRCGIPVVQTIHNFRLLCPGATFLRNGHVCEECIREGIFHACKYKCYRNSAFSTLAISFMTAFHKLIKTYKKVNFICLTEFNKNKLLEMNVGKKKYIDPNKVYVKPNFTDFKSEVIPWNQRKTQVVYAGRLDSTKGLHVLFESWKYIKDKNLVVCGVGPEESWCKDFIKKNDLTNVFMKGFVKHNDVMKIIGESQALILPTQWYEGFPMVLTESFACGTPVIGSIIGNVGSIIQDGVNGWKIDQSSIEDIIKKVESISNITRSTKECSEKLYSPEMNYEQLMNIYKQILSKN